MDNRPKTVEQYVELVRQALFEIEDLRAAVEYDGDSMGEALEFLDALEADIHKMYHDMKAGNYRFEERDLPYMKMLGKHDDRLLPFKYLLQMINATHKMGLDVEED